MDTNQPQQDTNDTTGKYTITDGGQTVVRWNTHKAYTKEQKAQQRAEFEQAAKSGQRVCLTDLFSTHGM